MKKIIFLNRFFYPDHSATSQILSDVAFHLAGLGAEVHVATSRLRYDDPAAALLPRETVGGVQVHRVATTRFGRARLLGRAVDYVSFYLSAARALWRIADHGTVVVAKTDPPMVSLVAAPIAHLRGAMLVNWLQDLFPEVAEALGLKLMRGSVIRLLRWARNLTLRQAHTNVVLGERMAARLIREGVPAESVRVIHNWADGAAIRPVPAEANPLRKEWDLEGRFVVGYSGNLGRAHEFHTVLEAAELLRDRGEVVFLFIGGGAQRRFVEEEATRRKLGNIRFRPYQPRERLAESLSVADVHLVTLSPALEGLIVPSKFYGIAAAGRPTLFVGDKDGEIPRLLCMGECGVAVGTGDSEGLAAAIRELADSPEQCARMGASARRLLETHFDRRIALRSWCEVLGVSITEDRNSSIKCQSGHSEAIRALRNPIA